MTDAPYTIETRGDGQFSISGRLDFKTAADVLEASTELFEDHSVIEVDFTGVTRSDSAGLALMLEWVNWARYSVREIHFVNVPEQIAAIAAISEVEEMLEAGQRWTQQ